ncbi:putative 60S ribosome biogenesis protein Rrp14 [Aspergillus brunneoviolaceus CBS 621.78]|nr:SURF6-domain-containing protein [Aspergillus brunneoviolaceus CBS 621.78]RAH44331.1 SURF6-domain-containing protein [Aspergillus brunneoviolaceus CBS 621.78]
MDDIEERLRDHAQAFDGLLSLIPAKNYYGEDGSDQWQRKKQTKEQAREAKRAKLDPDNVKTAKDVMDEKARKRKRNEEQAGEDAASEDGELGSEQPREGLKRGDAKSKKQKQTEDSANPDAQAKSNEAAEARRKLKEEKKAQKKANQKEKKKAKDAARKAKEVEQKSKQDQTPTAEVAQESESAPASKNDDNEVEAEDSDESDAAEGVVPEEGLSLEFNVEPESSSASTPNSSGFDASNPQSGSSSISSVAPSTDAPKSSTSNDLKPLKATSEQLKQRLQKRLDELRAARHADGLNGKPARNRQELIEARRQKAEQRKAHKKELRQKAREEEQRLKDEAMARRFSPGGSGSLLASPRSPADSVGSSSNANYSFGRVVFGDGQHADPTLQNVRDQPKRQGAHHDPAAALKAVEAKKARLASMDDERRADIEEKDMWLNAKKRAHGERVRDDTSLLKKALKRKETAKKKSEREWRERIDAVKHGKDMRQQKREENLRKRREEKGGNKGKKKPAAGGGKKKARPGFEGSFKAKAGGGGGKKK